jgi:spore germination cell wall hydrolase CwlJ-like protein
MQAKTKSEHPMLNCLLYKAQILAADLRHRSPFFWLTPYAGDLRFFTMLGLPFVTLGLIVNFSYTHNIEVQTAQQRHTDLTCLARNIYFEARGESTAGQRAVAEVTLNRVASKRFPDDVCGVVHEQRWDRIRKRNVGAFSWTELDSLSKPKGKPWVQAAEVAVAVYDSQEVSNVPSALFYHAERISPRWSKTKKMVAKIGHHKFYE